MRLAIRIVIVALLLVLPVRPATASTVLFQTDAQLIALSERVVHARVIAQRAVMAGAQGRTIYTVTTLAVIEDFTGVPGDTIEVWELGGILGGTVLYIGGAPQYALGQEVVVCLVRGPRGLQSVAMAFSKFDVRRQGNGDALLDRNLNDLAVAGAGPTARSVATRSLSEFRQTALAVTGRRSRVVVGASQTPVVAEPFTKIAGEPGWRWREADFRTPINYFRNTITLPPIPGDAVPELRTALTAWTAPTTASVMLQYAGTAFETDPGNGDAWTSIPQRSVLITFEDPNNELFPPVLAIGGGRASVGTGGTVGGTTYDGFDFGFIIVQNATQLPPSFLQSPDFTRVLTHEIGHTIGLGHTQTDGSVPNAEANIMYPSCCAALTPTPPALGADDLKGVNTLYPPLSSSGPTMSLDKTSLNFGAVTSAGSFAWNTSAQAVQLAKTGAGTVTWTATSTEPWLQVTPASGSGAATLTIRVVSPGALPASGSVDGAISLVFSGAANSPGPIAVRLTLTPTPLSQAPFGIVDTPLQSSTGVTGAVPFTGWALDDVEVDRVTLCRAAVAGEVPPVDAQCAGTAQIFVGTAVFIDGSRPDVQDAFRTYPLNSRGGWGFMVLTNTLPAQGNGNFVFTAYSFDREGHATPLGTRTMVCDNAHATLPFGTIDTPGQGDTVSGSAFVNFGWALTQQPKIISKDGSTISVYIDGTRVGGVSYDHPRSDIATLFPGYNNSTGPVGFRMIDTTALSNGLHTIVWTATDNLGASGGLGSRFFRVANGSSSVTAAAVASIEVSPAELNALPQERTPIVARRGWSDVALRAYAPGANGRAAIRGEELDRFEVWLGRNDSAADRYTGYLRVGDTLAPLPVGSQLNSSTGAFVWSPGVSFVGNYDLTFVRWANGHAASRRDVRVILAPKGSGRVGPQIVIDMPRSQQDVGQPFMLAGWAADLDADDGTGVSTVHVWAYPLTGGAPIFLGTPSMGTARPDVAAVHGEAFRDSGFGMVVAGLPHGNYDLAAFAWSTVRGSFVPAAVVRVTVR